MDYIAAARTNTVRMTQLCKKDPDQDLGDNKLTVV